MTKAEQLRQARKSAGLSMALAARLSGTPYTTWQGWEAKEGRQNARRPPGIAFTWLELYRQLLSP